MYAIAIAGGMTVHQPIPPIPNRAVDEWYVNDSICPQVTTAGLVSPKKLKVASSTKADATAIVMYKNVTWITLGKMCLKTILLGEAPATFAASINALVFKLMTSALIPRAVVGHSVNATPRITANNAWEGPQEKTMRATNGTEGHTKKAVLIRCKTASMIPP